MRKLHPVCIGLALMALLGGPAPGETFQLADGKTVSGEIILPANDEGLNLKVAPGEYQRIAWPRFTQETLKELAKNPKITPFAEPFIEVTPEEKIKRTEVPIKPVPRLDRPASRSVIGALFGSSVGLFALLLIYAANLYAGFEVSIFRAQPAALVCGASAVLPLIGAVLFLAMPTRTATTDDEEDEDDYDETPAEVTPAAEAPPAPAETEPRHGGLSLASRTAGPAAPGTPALPETQIFQRGQFTFNRRFFETKFPGFFGVVRYGPDKDMVMVINAIRGEYVAQRIARITSNEVVVEVRKGPASNEVEVPFPEIREIRLKHKDA